VLCAKCFLKNPYIQAKKVRKSIKKAARRSKSKVAGRRGRLTAEDLEEIVKVRENTSRLFTATKHMSFLSIP
jgi:hypothetical protein